MDELFACRPFLAAMVHLGALPGAPWARRPLGEVIAEAVEQSEGLAALGVDGIVLENMHDRPYLNREVGSEIVASMTAAVDAVRRALGPAIPLGLQILAGANKEALAAAAAGGAQFIRAEGFVFAHVADEGVMAEADAASLLRYRAEIGAAQVRIFADVKKKHSAHAITADVDLAATARAAEFFGADGVVVTGDETGLPVVPEALGSVRRSTGLPVIVGSGTTPENLPALARYADGFIVGSYIKREGKWFNAPDPARVREMVEAVRMARDGVG